MHDTTSRWRSKPRTRLAALGTALLLLSACSASPGSTAAPTGGGEASATPGAATPEPSAEATAAAVPSGDVSIMAPAGAGGGWDSTARSLQQTIKDAGLTTNDVEVYNVEGAGGTIGLAQFVDQKKGDPNALMVMGLVMVGAIRTNQAPVDLGAVTPIASLTAEYEAIAVKADSKYQTLDQLITDFKADPKSITWGGGSAGGTDHILVGLIAKAAGVSPADINYIAHSGGGEALDAILSGAVTAGVSGVSEFADQVDAGAMRYLAISGDAPLEGVDASTILDAGLDVTLANWRGIVAAPDITPEERDGLVAFVTSIHDTSQWAAVLDEKGWMDFFQAGDAFDAFLAEEQTKVEGVLKDIGLIE